MSSSAFVHGQVSHWMSKAESIKQYLTVRDLETREDAPAEMDTETETDHKSSEVHADYSVEAETRIIRGWNRVWAKFMLWPDLM